jgi:hypothetical protein
MCISECQGTFTVGSTVLHSRDKLEHRGTEHPCVSDSLGLWILSIIWNSK